MKAVSHSCMYSLSFSFIKTVCSASIKVVPQSSFICTIIPYHCNAAHFMFMYFLGFTCMYLLSLPVVCLLVRSFSAPPTCSRSLKLTNLTAEDSILTRLWHTLINCNSAITCNRAINYFLIIKHALYLEICLISPHCIQTLNKRKKADGSR